MIRDSFRDYSAVIKYQLSLKTNTTRSKNDMGFIRPMLPNGFKSGDPDQP